MDAGGYYYLTLPMNSAMQWALLTLTMEGERGLEVSSEYGSELFPD